MNGRVGGLFLGGRAFQGNPPFPTKDTYSPYTTKLAARESEYIICHAGGQATDPWLGVKGLEGSLCISTHHLGNVSCNWLETDNVKLKASSGLSDLHQA